jgi:hypothetical protein
MREGAGARDLRFARGTCKGQRAPIPRCEGRNCPKDRCWFVASDASRATHDPRATTGPPSSFRGAPRRARRPPAVHGSSCVLREELSTENTRPPSLDDASSFVLPRAPSIPSASDPRSVALEPRLRAVTRRRVAWIRQGSSLIDHARPALDRASPSSDSPLREGKTPRREASTPRRCSSRSHRCSKDVVSIEYCS